MIETPSDIERKIKDAEYDLKQAENDKDTATRKVDDLKTKINGLEYDLEKAKRDEEYENRKIVE
ncbi:MAG: hypothetical protein HZA94_00440 [Candidatus Vogelbacteria bacterium]|nr:hypothetical protein [Candidatus Vogelbacteria bacterium]